jgi:hypothetical protein
MWGLLLLVLCEMSRGIVSGKGGKCAMANFFIFFIYLFYRQMLFISTYLRRK